MVEIKVSTSCSNHQYIFAQTYGYIYGQGDTKNNKKGHKTC